MYTDRSNSFMYYLKWYCMLTRPLSLMTCHATTEMDKEALYLQPHLNNEANLRQCLEQLI